MNNHQNNENKISGNDARDSSYNFLQSFARAVVKTEEFEGIVHALVPELLKTWAGGNFIKKSLSRPIRKSVQKGFKKNGAAKGAPILELMGDNEFLEDAAAGVPELIDGVLEAVAAATRSISNLPMEEKKKIVDAFLNKGTSGNIGAIITNFMAIINDLHKEDPLYLSEKLRPRFRTWLEHTDFGEIKEAVSTAGDDIANLVSMVNEEMWQYPAKFICLMSLIPDLANITFRSLSETAKPMNDMPPDLLADVVLTMLREIDGREVGELINQANELIRKIHTGSTLIGEQGSPKLPDDVSELAGNILDTVDIDLLLKSRTLLAEIKETTAAACLKHLEQNPKLAREFIHGYFTKITGLHRKWSRGLDIMERFLSPQELREEFERGIKEIDAQEMAGSITRLCTIFNELHEEFPGIVRDPLTQIIQSIDEYEAAETVKHLADDIAVSLKPLAPGIMPPILRGLADLLTPGNDDSDFKEALADFRKALISTEVSS